MGKPRLEGAYNWSGERCEHVRWLALAKAHFQTGLLNPLDESLKSEPVPDFRGVSKLGEIPYDFVRKRMSVVLSERLDGQIEQGEGKHQLVQTRIITKGSFELLLFACQTTEDGVFLDEASREKLMRFYRDWTKKGVRVLGVATRVIGPAESKDRWDECALAFSGFLTFFDPPKPDAQQAISELRDLGVSVKVISGDSADVVRFIAASIGLNDKRVLTGHQLDNLHEEALWCSAIDTDLFAEVDPNQKERIILSLKKRGCVVGFLGDGINDAPAMHAADTAISVEGAVDVAREAADFVLLKSDLGVICRGIEEGRKTFANSLKYILTTMSANLGNMLSMAVASVFLPFLPLLASQILLNNFLSDLPALGLADDRVDPELVNKPRRWDMKFIARFITEFGLLSSFFDLLAFSALLFIFRVDAQTFRTAWFVESLLTELAVAFVVRTRRSVLRSRPSRFLVWSSVVTAAVTVILPYSTWSQKLGFVPLSGRVLVMIFVIVAFYVMMAELAKDRFFRATKQFSTISRES